MADENPDKKEDSDKEGIKKEEKGKRGKPKKNFRYHYSRGRKNAYIAAVIIIIVLAAIIFTNYSMPRLSSSYNTSESPGGILPENPDNTLPDINANQTASQENAALNLTGESNETNQTSVTNETAPPSDQGLSGVTTLPPEPVNGLTAQYFTNVNMAGDPASTKTIPKIEFVWSDSNTPAPDINYKRFSARFLGNITIEKEGDYTFILTSDDGSRLYVDGVQRGQNIWDNVGVSSTSSTISLKTGKHSIRVDYRNIASSAKIKLEYWASSIGVPRQIIPSDVFSTS